MLKQLRYANLARAKDWGVTQTDLSFAACELAGEVGEACNNIKKRERARLGLLGGLVDDDNLIDELADVIICVDLIAMKLDIDLAAAVQRKFDKTSAKVGLKSMEEYLNDAVHQERGPA